MADVEYSDRSVSVERPNEKRSTVVVYARPGDTINLGFSVNDGKLSFVSSDIVFTFGDGSQVVVASMGSLAFTENPPKMYDSAGTLIDLEEILKRAEQIKVTDALLILTTNDEVTLVELEEEVKEVVSAMDAEDEGVGGSPDEGGGPLKFETRGHVSDVYDPLGEVDDYNTMSGIGPATVSDGESIYAFNSEEEYSLPGEIPLPKRKSIEVIYYYGDEANKLDDPVEINGDSYEYYDFVSPGGYSEDPLVQVQPVSFDINTDVPVFFNARYEGDQVNRNFTIRYKTVTPTEIRISGLPEVVSVSLQDENSATLTSKEDLNGSTVWYLDNIVSYQKIDLQLNYAEGISYNNRSISIEVDYYDGEEGRADTIEFKQVVSFKPVRSAEELDSTSTTILSSTPPGVNIDIENGGLSDIVVGGSAGNEMRVTGGDDFVFSNVGDDKAYLGVGNDTYFASSGTDYVAGGDGEDIAYYNNNRDETVVIDDPSNYLGDAYETFTNQGSVDGYVGYVNQNALLSDYGVSLDSDFPEIEDDDVLFFSGGVQVYDNFEQFYLSQGNDRIFVNDDFVDVSVQYVFHTGSYGKNGTDALYFSDASNGIVVNLADDQVVYGASSEGVITGISGFDLIEGTAQDDVFNLDMSSVKEDSLTLIGGSGEDVINGSVSGSGGTGLEFNFVDFTIRKNELITGKVAYFEEIESFVGSDQDDMFYGASTSISYNLDGGAGNDILSYEKSYQGVTFDLEDGQIYKTVNFVNIDDLRTKSHDTFVNFEEVRASGRGDIFLLSDAGQALSTVDGLDGDDTIDASYTSGPATFILGLEDVTGQVSYGSYTLSFIDVEVLIGTNNDDIYTADFQNGSEANFTLDGLEGTDTLTFAGSNNLVKIDFSRNRVTTKGATDATTSIFLAFSNIERFIGSEADDTFYLSNDAVAAGYYLDGGGNAAGTYDVLSFEKVDTTSSLVVDVLNASITLGGETVSFINFEGVIGTKNDDTFIAGEIGFKFDGAGGEDSIDYSALSGSITFDQEAKTVVKSDFAGADDYLSNVEIILATKGDDLFKGSYYGGLTIDGNRGKDTLKYENAKNAMTFNIEDTITVEKGSSVDNVTNFEVIYGGRSTDTFVLSNGDVDGGVKTIELHGSADDTVMGQNILDLTAFDALSVSVDAFSQGAGLSNAAGVDFKLYNFYTINLSDNDDAIAFVTGDSGAYNIDGGAGTSDTADYSAMSSVNIQIKDKGVSVARDSDGKDNLVGFENIVATDGDDVINFSATEDVDVSIDLLGGYDSISFVSFRGQSVTFDFGTDITITAVNSTGTPIDVVFSGAEVFSGSGLVDQNLFNIHQEIMSYTASKTQPIVIAGQAGSAAESIVTFDGFSGGVTLDFINQTLANGGSTLDIRFQAITQFVLTDGDDTIINQVNSSTTFDGGAGTDLADYSGLGMDSTITVDVATGQVTKNANLTVDYYTNVEKVVGTDGEDSFMVGNTASGTGFTELDGAAGDDYLSFENSTAAITYDKGVLNSGALPSSITTVNIENLKGSQGDDTFIITSGELLIQFDGAGDTKATGGVGDTIKFEGSNVEYRAYGLSVTVEDSGVTYTFDNVENIDAGTGDQTYFGSSAVNIRYDGGAGADILNYENVLFGITFDFAGMQVIKDNSGENVDQFANVETFIGTSSSDIFKISDGSYNPGGVITLDGGDGADYLDFSNITNAVVDIGLTSTFFGVTYDLVSVENYQFGDSDDTVNIIDETQSYNVFMYGGNDTANYSTLSDSSLAIVVQYDIFGSNVSVEKGAGSGNIDSISMVENILATNNDDFFYGTADMDDMSFDGSSGNDTATYAEDQDPIQADFDGNKVSIQKGGRDTDGDSLPDEFSGADELNNVEMIIGTGGDDVFIISATTPSFNMTIDGGSGSDFLSFRNYTSALTGDLSSLTATGYTAVNFESIEGTLLDDTIEVTSDTENIGFSGGGGNDTLNFDSSSTGGWGISLDLVNNSATRTTGGSFSVSNVENYNLTDKDDYAKLSQTAIDNNYQIDGGAGSDTGDLSEVDLTASKVTINVDTLLVDGTTTLRNFERYNFYEVQELHWNISGTDVSKYTITTISNSSLYFDISDVVVDSQALTFTSTNFTGAAYYSRTITGFHFSSGTNRYVANNLEDVEIVGSADSTSVDTLDLSFVTSGVSLLTEGGGVGGASGSISRGGQVTETFSDIDEIILTSYNDNLTLTEFSGGSKLVVIDGGSGTDSVAITSGGTGVNVDLGSGGSGSGSTTYDLINVENTSLSEFDDVVHSTAVGDFDLDAKAGMDTIDYTQNDNIPVTLQILEVSGEIKATAQKHDSSAADPTVVTGRDFMLNFEIYNLGSHDDQVMLNTALTQEVKIDGGGGNNSFYYLGTDISESGAIDMSIESKGNFMVGTLSVSNFEEIYLQTIKYINFDIDLDKADGFRLFLSEDSSALYTFNFTSTSTIVFDNVAHTFSNASGDFILETNVHNLDFGSSDVNLDLGVDQTFQNMSFSSSGMIYVEFQEASVNSVDLLIDGDATNPHASLQINSSYNFEFTSSFTMELITGARIEIKDSAAQTAYTINSDVSVKPSQINYTLEYGANVSSVGFEDRQNTIMYGAMNLALGNSQVNVDITGEVNFGFGFDMDASSYEYRRYNVYGNTDYASFNLYADASSQYVTSAGAYTASIDAISSEKIYTVNIYNKATGEKDLEFNINNALALGFDAGSNQDIEVGVNVSNFTLNESVTTGSTGILTYQITGADTVMHWTGGVWTDQSARNNVMSFSGAFYFDASSMSSGGALTLGEVWDPSTSLDVSILNIEGKEVNFDVTGGSSTSLSLASDGITVTDGGATTTISFDINSTEGVNVSIEQATSVSLSLDFIENLNTNVVVAQTNDINLVFQSSTANYSYFDMTFSSTGVSIANASGYYTDFQSSVGVESVVLDNPDAMYNVNLVGNDFGGGSDDVVEITGTGHLSVLTLDKGARLHLSQSTSTQSFTVTYNDTGSRIRFADTLWFRDDVWTEIRLSPEPDTIVFQRVAITTEQLSGVDFGDDTLATEDRVEIGYEITGTQFLEIKVDENFSTTFSRSSSGDTELLVANFGVVNSITGKTSSATNNEFVYTFAALQDSVFGDLSFYVNSAEHLDNVSGRPRARASFSGVTNVGAMSVTIVEDASAGQYQDTVTDSTGGKGNIILKNVSVFSLSQNTNTSSNNSVSQGDLEHDYIFDNSLSVTSLDYSATFSGSVDVVGQTVIKKDTGGTEQSRDLIIGNYTAPFLHNEFNLDLTTQTTSTILVIDGTGFAFSDVRATDYDDVLVISGEIYEGFSGQDKYAAFDMAGGNDTLLVDDINNDLYLGRSASSFRNLDMQNAMSVEEGGRGIFVSNIETVSFDTAYANVHIGAYAQGFNLVAEESTTVFIESEEMDVSFKFVDGGTVSFEDLNSQTLVFSADDDNYSYNGVGLEVEGEFDLVGTTGDDIFEINGDNISSLQSIDGLGGSNTLNISGSIQSASEFSDNVTNINRIVFDDMETNSIDLSIDDIIKIKGDQDELLIDVKDSDFNVNIVDDGNSDYSYTLEKDGEYMMYSLFDSNSQEIGKVVVNDGVGLDEDGIYMQGSESSEELTITSKELGEVASIDGGEGFDTLELNGSLADMEGLQDKTQNIEKIVINDVDETSANLNIEDAMNMTDDKNKLVIDIEDDDFDLNIVNDGSDYSYSVKSDGEHDVYTVYSDENQKDEVGQIIVNHNNNNGNHS